MTPDNSDARWHLKKEIQLTHLITTMTVAVSVIFYINKMEQRIALLEQHSTTQAQRDERQDRNSAETAGLLRSQLDRLEAKIDRLIESKR